jgi:hypothetical protein
VHITLFCGFITRHSSSLGNICSTVFGCKVLTAKEHCDCSGFWLVSLILRMEALHCSTTYALLRITQHCSPCSLSTCICSTHAWTSLVERDQMDRIKSLTPSSKPFRPFRFYNFVSIYSHSKCSGWRWLALLLLILKPPISNSCRKTGCRDRLN